MSNYFNQNDITRLNGKLTSHKAGGKKISEEIKYDRLIKGKELPYSKDKTEIVPRRTILPRKRYEFGVDREGLPKLSGPYRFASKPIQDYGRHLPVWTGWRPRYPAEEEKNIPDVMPRSQRGPKYETKIPSEQQIVTDAFRNATAPYPAVPPGFEIPNEYENYNTIYSEGSGTMMGHSGLGQFSLGPGISAGLAQKVSQTASEEAAKAAAEAEKKKKEAEDSGTSFDLGKFIVDTSKDIADIIRLKYQKEIEEEKTEREMIGDPTSPFNQDYIGEEKKGPDIPWGIIGIGAAIAVAAIFIIPKIGK